MSDHYNFTPIQRLCPFLKYTLKSAWSCNASFLWCSLDVLCLCSDVWSDVWCLLLHVRSRCPMSDVCCLISDIWCLLFDIRRLMSVVFSLMFIRRLFVLMSDVWCLLLHSEVDVRCLMFVFWYQTSDVCCLISDVWCLLSDVSNLIFVVRSLFSDVYQKSDVCCLITDVRRLMFVVRFMFVFWCRCQTSDVWCLLSDAMPDVWCLLSDVLCQTNDVFRFQTSCCVMSVVWCQMSDVRRPMFVVYQTTNIYLSDVHQTSYVCVDVWCQTSDVCCLLFVVRFQTSHVSHLTSCQTFDVWCQTSDVYCLMSDIWHLKKTSDIWQQTSDVWHQATNIRRLIWDVHQTTNIKPLISDVWNKTTNINKRQTSDIRHLTSDNKH